MPGKGKKYIVRDSHGYYLRSFHTYEQASTYKTMCGRHDWTIEQR